MHIHIGDTGATLYFGPTVPSLFCASFVPIAAELWRSSIKGRACARDLLPLPPAALRSDLLYGGEVEFSW